jgi:hypothetical protein
LYETKISELESTAVVATSNTPEAKVAVPMEALDPVAIESLFPACPSTRLPFVAVMAPEVAVKVVAEVIEPALVAMLPAVTVTPPVVTIRWLPTVIEVVEARDPGAITEEGSENVIV